MNLAKILNWRKALIYTHRWMGIVGGLLFVSWFVSGVAMMYWSLPTFSDSERLAHLAPVDLSTATVEPADAARAAGLEPTSLRVAMYYDGRPVYRFQDRVVVYADTGEVVAGATVEQAMALVRRLEPAHAATVRYDRLIERSDQWTLAQTAVSQMPLHRIAVGDPGDTYYYVSQKTGEPVQQTDRTGRWQGFLSGVLHYVYFPPLRWKQSLWDAVIVWGAFAGCLMCLSGLFVGIWRFSSTPRFRHKGVSAKTRSPYAGLMRWHHYAGLLFGLVSFTWILSGGLSINPYGWFSGTGASAAQRLAATGGPIRFERVTLDDLRRGIAVLAPAIAPKEVDVEQFRGELFLTAARPQPPVAGERYQTLPPAPHGLVWLKRPEAGLFTTFDRGVMLEIAREAMPATPIEDAVWLTAYDNYYRSRTASRPLPVLRVRFADDQRTWLYLDPQHGTIAQSFDRSSRLRRWLYNGLHTFDLPIVRDYRVVSDIAMILLSIGGLALSVTTLWPSWSRLRRNTKRMLAGDRSPAGAVPRPAPGMARESVARRMES